MNKNPSGCNEKILKEEDRSSREKMQGRMTPYLSVHCFLEASSYMFTLRVVRSDVTIVTVVTIGTGVTGVWVSAALLGGCLLHAPWLGALLHRVGPLCDDRSLSRLDTGYLVDLDLGLGRVLNVDIHQGGMERYWRRTDPQLIE